MDVTLFPEQDSQPSNLLTGYLESYPLLYWLSQNDLIDAFESTK